VIDIVLITTGSRQGLFEQSLKSMRDNAADWKYSLTVVVDMPNNTSYEFRPESGSINQIIFLSRVGASAARNIGASSIPRYRRGQYVMFCDDDVYFCPRWDHKLLELAHLEADSIISGHSHPYNGSELRTVKNPLSFKIPFREPLVISSVHMMMPLSLWDEVGYFVEPGGPGGSEDYDYCMRAKDKSYGFAITEPECVIHTGLTSTAGKPIIGHKEVIAHNDALIQRYGLQGKIICL
jgi:GT2 family glycosyltransferase